LKELAIVIEHLNLPEEYSNKEKTKEFEEKVTPIL